MNENAKWIEYLLLNDLQSDDEVLAELGADAPEIIESARKTTAALSWLRSLPDEQVVRVPKMPDTPDTDYGVGYSHAYADCTSAMKKLNPGVKIEEV